MVGPPAPTPVSDDDQRGRGTAQLARPSHRFLYLQADLRSWEGHSVSCGWK